MSQKEIDMAQVYNETEEVDDRGPFVEGDRRNTKPGVKALIAMCGLTVVGLAGLFVYNVANHVSDVATDTAENVAEQVSSASAPPRGNSSLEPLDRGTQTEEEFRAAQARRLAALERSQPSPPADTPDTPATSTAQTSTPAPAENWRTQRNNTADQPPSPEQLILERRLAGTLTNENESSSGNGASAMYAAQPGMGGQSNMPMLDGGVMSLGGEGGGSGGGTNAELGGRLNGSVTRPTRATVMENQSFLLSKGQTIPCGTITELDTTVPGMISCQVSRDIYSFDHRVVLVEQGSRVIGTIEGGLSQGQARVFALWEEIRTPRGVRIPLNSPGTNRLGSSGIPGQVDTHFWERYRGAILFSILSDAGTALVQSSTSGSSIQLNSTASSQQALAQEALRNSINIPPTLYVSHGDNVSIFVARDVDFSDVYALESINGRG